MSSNIPGENVSYENKQEIIAWLQRNSIPVRHIEAGNGFADLQPLKALLKDVQVVGLGEATHGTREFFQMKHRMLEFLVIEMNFTAFTIEASFAACQPINGGYDGLIYIGRTTPIHPTENAFKTAADRKWL